VLKLGSAGTTFRKNGHYEAHRREPNGTDIVSMIKQYGVDLKNDFCKKTGARENERYHTKYHEFLQRYHTLVVF
jgi:hypothetical protein